MILNNMAGSIVESLINGKLISQLLATVVTYYILRLTLFLLGRHKRFQLLKHYGIPGPKPRLLDGSLAEYTKGERTYKIDENHRKQYGSVYGIYFGDHPEVTFTDLETLRVIFFERASSFRERTIVHLENSITKSILMAGHNRWKAMRRLMSPSFSGYNIRGQASIDFIDDTIQEMLGYVDKKLLELPVEQRHKGVNVDILDLMKATALSLIAGIAINLPGVQVKENEPNVENLDHFVTEVSEGAYRLAVCFPFLRKPLEFLAEHFEYSKTLGDIRRGLAKTIDACLEDLRRAQRGQPVSGEKRPQMIEALTKLHHEGAITRDEVMSNCEAILIAGYDTTSTTLSYIFWTLGKYPEIQEKLRSELMVHGTESEYLEQVINEVMRLYPTLLNFTTRLATETVQVGDITIPSGTTISYKTWLMHRDPKLWPEPEKFDPERFRKGVEIHPCAFAPFGLGERKCLGIQLAKRELKMITCDTLIRFKLTTISPYNLELKTHSMVLSRPVEKIIVNLTKL